MPTTTQRQTSTGKPRASGSRGTKLTLPEASFRPLSLSAEAFHDAVMEELPKWRGKEPEEVAAEAVRRLNQLRSRRLIDKEEEELIRQCLKCLERDDGDGAQGLCQQIAARQKASPVAVAVMGVASSSVKTIEARAKSGARAAAKKRGLFWVALFDVAGAIGGGLLGGGIGGVGGAIIGATVVGAAFSAGEAYDVGLIP